MKVLAFDEGQQPMTDTDVISGLLEDLKIKMVINSWSHDVTLFRDGKMVRDGDSLYIDVINHAQSKRFVSRHLNKNFISDLIKRNAEYVDPVLEFFENNKWDGKSRDRLVKEALHLSKTDMAKLKLWFRQGAAIVYNDGSPTDIQRNFMLILYSREQGNGKSTLVKKLSLNTGSFGDSTIDLKINDSVRKAYESWIYEYPELSSMFRKADVNMLKTFITASAKSFRLAYDKFFTKYPTRTSIVGTTNDEEIFIDDTGSRRFLVIHADWGRDDWDKINKINWGQVWLQARQEYLDGKSIVMTADEQRKNDIENNKYSYTSAACYKLMAYVEDRETVAFDGLCSIKLTDIVQTLTAQHMDSNTKMIFSTMNKLGYRTLKTKTSCTFEKDMKTED